MLESLKMTNDYKNNKEELWLNYLYNTKEKNYNVLNVKSIKQINKHSVLNYVKRTLEILNDINNKECLDNEVLFLVEETLKWSEVAKTGSKKDRKRWLDKKYDLFCHNIGSSEIYNETNNNIVVSTLIRTHGLIGQYIKGEVNLEKNILLYELVRDSKISKDKLRKVLQILNRCIIEAVSKDLYNKVESRVNTIIEYIMDNEIDKNINPRLKLEELNGGLSENDIEYIDSLESHFTRKLKMFFEEFELWYYESALKEFCISDQIKILLYIFENKPEGVEYLSFEFFMHSMYLDYKDKREINIYKKRIIENFLKDISLEDIVNHNINPNPHIDFNIKRINKSLVFNFKFSIQAKKLIEFCEVACTSNSLYQRATYMLYDLFGFRKDAYDRFYNEIDYLNTMNNSLKEKAIILDYIVGNSVLDVGPGGGALLDLIEKEMPDLDIKGIDLSENVINELAKKKLREGHIWNIIKGDALNLSKYFDKDSLDTIIYSSIIHELYSYIPYNGKKFNKETIKVALQEAYSVLKVGGRIIIRDGIMSTPVNSYRIIEFNDEEDIKKLDRYINDFKGRKITYEKINDNTVKMLINDAMEFLYTYTWGEESYPLEVQEQFGYFTLEEYINFIKENLPNSKIIESKSYLQKGYEKNLLPKINIYDENMNVVSLPDSTSIIVIEKENLNGK